MAGTVTLVASGALAFGAVYQWAYVPLAVASGLLGAVALRHAVLLPREARRVGLALAAVAFAAALQVVPLPSAVRQTISPRTDALLTELDLGFALRSTAAAEAHATLWHPLSVHAAAGRRALLLVGGFSLLLLGVTALLGAGGAAPLTLWLVTLGVLLAVIGIVQQAVLGNHAYGGMKIYGFWAPDYKLTTPFGPFVNKNHFAGWMVMVLPLALGYVLGLTHVAMRRLRPGWRNRVLWLSSPGGGRVQVAIVAVAVMSAALMMTTSRSGVGCFLVAIAIAGAVAVKQQATRRARLVVIGLLTALAVVPLLWANESLVRRFEGGLADPTVQLRRDAWTQALAIVRELPLAGSGLNTFGVAALPYGAPGRDFYFREAHNEYLQLAAEGGVLVGVPVIVTMALFVVAVRRRFAEDSPEQITYWIRFGACTGLVAIALQSIVEFSLQMPGNAVLFVVLAAIAMHRPRA